MALLDRIERWASLIPHPVLLFCWLTLFVLVASAVAAAFGLEARHPATGDPVAADSLLQGRHLRRLLSEMPQIFTAFPPFGSVLTIVIGLGIAERSGLIAGSLGDLLRRAPPPLLPLAVVFAGILSSIAVDAGFLVLPPLAAALFAAAGRHPVAGIAAAYAGVSGDFSANLLITGLDPLLAGLTQAAAALLVPGYTVLATANWFLMVTFVPALAIVGALVTTRLIEPRLGQWVAPESLDGLLLAPADRRDRAALVRTGWAALGLLAGLALLVVPPGAVLRDPSSGSLEPLFQAVVAIIALSLAILGIVYGRARGTIRTSSDAVHMAERGLADMAIYILLAFVAAHFLALFAWSNLGTLMAIGGGGLLRASGLGPVPLLLGFILLCGLINLFMTSASAKWALLAPVFVPMFMGVGLSPELTQAAYRVGDSATNIIAPTMVYVPIILAVAMRYVPGFGLGQLMATMLPYALVFLPLMSGILLLFLALDIPLGPGAPPSVSLAAPSPS